MLLIPEGVVNLNATAAAALALVDGKRTLGDIVVALQDGNFDAEPARIAADVDELFARLRARRLLQ
jgi:coenzyme PQQ biosynthesis protein PqqD